MAGPLSPGPLSVPLLTPRLPEALHLPRVLLSEPALAALPLSWRIQSTRLPVCLTESPFFPCFGLIKCSLFHLPSANLLFIYFFSTFSGVYNQSLT